MPSNAEELIRELNGPHAGTNFAQLLYHQVPKSPQPSALRLLAPFIAVITRCSKSIGQTSTHISACAGATWLVSVATPTDLKISLLGAPSGEDASAEQFRSITERDHGGRLDLLVNHPGQINIPLSTSYIGRFLPMRSFVPLLPKAGTEDERRREEIPAGDNKLKAQMAV
ncbi:hypothetical protein F5Y19DRAFT_479185 [Xylariaceae sp. FL1651]|nr:hypothetical protein F5Y19DRAFT_479185 [Xylariaceae sp. FL1651]